MTNSQFMASMSFYRNFIISTAIFVLHALAASHDEIVEAGCKAASVKNMCAAALSPGSCYDNLNSLIDSNVSQSHQILKNTINVAMVRLSSASLDFAVNGTVEELINASMPNNRLALSALESCRELLSLAMDNLNNSFSSTGLMSVETRGNIKSWLCAAGADLQTCVHGFDDQVYSVRNLVLEKLSSSIHSASNSQAIVTLIDRCSSSSNGNSSRTDLVGQGFSSHVRDHDPYWLPSQDRRMLQASEMYANVVVAKDGSGNYRRISDALRAVPNYSNKRFVIYVKNGIYHENVKVERYKWNVMMYGDGMDTTIVYGNLSYGGGRQTLDTATFAVYGKGFIARDMGFMNTAGPTMYQAVALLSAADRSVFYRCRIDSYQDTLYAHSNRQFYRECHIYGTIDFIFGDAAVVIQNSTIYPKRPQHGQQNTITAHQKTNQYCETGIVVQYSMIKSPKDLSGVNTFLGRPWSAYSTTVFMQNYMHSLINPKGWMPWNDDEGAPPPASTIFLAENNNRGPGANTADRVRWDGVRVNLSHAEASRFTVHSLIKGDLWLPATNVSYRSGL